MNSFTNRQKGVASLILLAIIFASMGIFARYLSESFMLFQQVYLRILAAAILCVLLFRKSIDFKNYKKLSLKEWILIISRSITFYVLGVTLFTLAYDYTKYGTVSIIGSLPFVALYGFVFLKEKTTWQKILLVILSFVGTMIITAPDTSHLFDWGKGEVLALISTACFSWSYIARVWHTKTLNNKEITTAMLIVSFFILLGVSLIKGDGLPIPSNGWSAPLIGMIILAGLFNIANLFLVNYGFEKVESVFASNILTLEVLFAVIIGFLLYGEVLNWKEVFGGVIIIGSVIGMNYLEE